MKPIKRVLCAIDLSEGGDVALRQADAEARAHGAELVVLHALPTFPGVPMSPRGVEDELVERERVGRGVIDQIVARVQTLTGRPSDEFGIVIEDGPAHAAVLRKAEEMAADLVVVGSHGGGALRRVVLGGVAERVIRYSHASVMVARAADEGGPVLVPTDFSAPAERACEVGAAEARRRGVRLVLMHATELGALALPYVAPAAIAPGPMAPSAVDLEGWQEVRRAAQRRTEDALAATGLPGEALLEDQPATVAIPEVAGRVAASLVVLGTSGRTGATRVLLGSVAESVVRSAPCSVLVVR